MTKKFFIDITPLFKVHLLFFPLAAASFLGNYHLMFFAAYLCAAMHEFGHILCARFLGVKVSHIEILPFGICAKLKSNIIKNPSAEEAIAASGPLVNIFLCIIVFLLKDNLSADIFIYLERLNLSLCVINLIPALPLDGGRIMRAYLTKKIGAVKAYNISIKLSCFPVAILWGISVYSLLANCFNFSIILISSFLLANLCFEQKNISKNILCEMMQYQTKLEKNAFTSSRIITAYSTEPARLILKKLSYDRYYIVCVVDNNLKIAKFLTEGQVLSALTSKGIRVTLGEI